MPATIVELHEGAFVDVREALKWYQARSPDLAADFVEELGRAIETIREAPDRWPTGMNDTRKFLLWRFPFSVIYSYSAKDSRITVWAVAHGSRRPGYWESRSAE